jgi:hypothetical protein
MQPLICDLWLGLGVFYLFTTALSPHLSVQTFLSSVRDSLAHADLTVLGRYTIMAVLNAPVVFPESRLVLRVLSSPEWPVDQSYANEFEPHFETGEIRPLRTPGAGYLEKMGDGSTNVRYDVLFRFQVQFPSDQLVSIQFAVNPSQVPGAVLQLDVFREHDEGEVVSSVIAKNCAFIPFVSVDGSDEAAQAAGIGGDEKAPVKGAKPPPRGSKSAKSFNGTTGVDPQALSADPSKPAAPKMAKCVPPALLFDLVPFSTCSGFMCALPGRESDPADLCICVSGCRYVIRGRLLEGQMPEPLDKGEGKKGKQLKKVQLPMWKLQIFTDGKALVAESRARADEIESEQIGWEAVEEGRSVKSAEIRKAFLESSSDSAGGDMVVVERPTADDATADARVFDERLQVEREGKRNQAVREYEARCAQLVELSQQRVDARREGKSEHIAKFDKLAELRATRLNAAVSKRQEYRQRVIGEAAALERVNASREAALAAEMQIRELLDPALANGGGGGKKKKK